MAGALAKHFERVEIFERDRLTASAASRSGTPQARAGAVSVRLAQDIRYERPDVGVLPKRDFGISFICASRPLIELVLRGRAEAIANIPLRRPAAWHHLSIGLLRMALDAVANVVMRDHLLQERARLETNLQQARRMETVGALASGIAHNFNNIVGAILGHTEMAEAQLASDSRLARSIKEIRRAGERARDLVDQILAFGRGRDLRRRPVSMKAEGQ
jgi:signal transduction histidine kinase